METLSLGPSNEKFVAVLGSPPSNGEPKQILAVELETGKVKWQTTVANFDNWATDSTTLYILGRPQQIRDRWHVRLFAYHWKTGQQIWQTDAGEVGDNRVISEGKTVFVHNGHVLLGLDAATGHQQWSMEIEGAMQTLARGQLYFHQFTDAHYIVPVDAATRQKGKGVMFKETGGTSYFIRLRYQPQKHLFVIEGIEMPERKSVIVMTPDLIKLWVVVGSGDYGGPSIMTVSDDLLAYTEFHPTTYNRSKQIVVRELKSGKIRWQRKSRENETLVGIANGAAIVADDKAPASRNYSIVGLNLQNGKPLWSLSTRAPLLNGQDLQAQLNNLDIEKFRIHLYGQRLLSTKNGVKNKPARLAAYALPSSL